LKKFNEEVQKFGQYILASYKNNCQNFIDPVNKVLNPKYISELIVIANNY
jgi:hypothetical protein